MIILFPRNSRTGPAGDDQECISVAEISILTFANKILAARPKRQLSYKESSEVMLWTAAVAVVCHPSRLKISVVCRPTSRYSRYLTSPPPSTRSLPSLLQSCGQIAFVAHALVGQCVRPQSTTAEEVTAKTHGPRPCPSRACSCASMWYTRCS